MIYIGIDPGLAGGIAHIGHDEQPHAQKMLDTMTDIFGYIHRLQARDIGSQKHVRNVPVLRSDGMTWGPIAYIEKVASSPQMGVKSAFTFGKGYGSLLMALTAAGIPYTEVAPAVWQKKMGCLSHGDKNVTKNRAQQLFPSIKVTHNIADALLIAEYGRRKELGL